ncbi:MAG: diheme cytochrome c [Gammaproteobacteria bacterium]|nr:diheme cytochrome c [Gammaproteobacteria bacterium]
MKKSILISSIIIASMTTSLVYCSGGVGDGEQPKWFGNYRLGVAPVTNQLYRSECGSCHFAYQPGLLPSRSWKKLMSGLDDHFGDNAELMPEDYTVIIKYLTKNSAEFSDHKRSRRINNSLAKDDTPLRITDTPYFKRKHRELSLSQITNNPEIGSISNCVACHRQADKGSFSEGEIKIPGEIGWWE